METNMANECNRRKFLKTGLGFATGVSFMPFLRGNNNSEQNGNSDPLFKISLAQWSLHRSMFSVRPSVMGWSKFNETLHSDNYRSLVEGEIDPLDFAKVARREFGIEAIEYVNTFYFDRAKDRQYLTEMKKVANGEGVRSLLIMCDREGDLGNPDRDARSGAVENHFKWVEAAKFLGCHSIRVNARSDAGLHADEQMKLAAAGLRRLCEFSDQHKIDVLVENHGGLSSNGAWLVGVMKMVDHPRVGTLPDFGNFRIAGDQPGVPETWYDRYTGVREMMPYAKAVSAKSHKFDNEGNEVNTDFKQMMKIVLDAGYRGYVGIEYEGDEASEKEGIKATKNLLERVRKQLASEYA